MAEARKTIRVFFSWQSDLDETVTTLAIRKAMRGAMSAVEADFPVHMVLDEATRNLPGSPYIPYALADKISEADIFVGDITTVVRLDGQTGKSFPNPNVTFELGIASAELGWNRIIMLFNTALAEFDQLPFDFDRHRISKFKFSAAKEERKQHESNLLKLTRDALAMIVRDNPMRPRELQQTPPEQIKRKRDIENLRAFLNRISTVHLDQHIHEMPTYLYEAAMLMAGTLEELRQRSDFRFYDSDLTAAVHGIIDALTKNLSHSGHYNDTRNPNKQRFGRPGDLDMFADDDQKRAWEEINEGRRELKMQLEKLISIVRERYMEIDIDETNRAFHKAYASYCELDEDDD